MKAGSIEYELKSMKYVTELLNKTILEEYSNEILVEIISMKLSNGVEL